MENLTQLAHSFHAAVTIVANNHSGLSMPLMDQIVDGILDHGGISPIIGRQNEDEAECSRISRLQARVCVWLYSVWLVI